MFKVKMFLCVCLCVLSSLPAPAKGDTIEVRNTDARSLWLSDLIVYGENDQKKVILAPNDPNDDIIMSPDATRVFDVDFQITEYVISRGGMDMYGRYQEVETNAFALSRITKKKLPMIREVPITGPPEDWVPYELDPNDPGYVHYPDQYPEQDPNDQDPNDQQTVVLEVDQAVAPESVCTPPHRPDPQVVLEVDQAVAPEPPPEGTVLAVVEGYNELMPGWFVGTDIDFETGEVTGAYTGDVEVLCTAFEVMVFTPPYPPDGAVNIPLNAKLYWPESRDADWYDVYFGTRSLPTYMGDKTANDYEPYELEPCTTYYWKIKQVIEHIVEWPDEPDPNGPPDEPDPNEPPIIEMLPITTEVVWYEIVEGPIWSFTTGPAKATNPHPIHCATDVDPNAILSWKPGCFADFQDVYLGTDFVAVANADKFDTTGIYRGRQTFDTNSFDPGGLALGQICYWRIDPVNEPTPDSPWNGDIWSFMTADYLVLDDMESYTDDLGNRIFETWKDGYGYGDIELGYPGNGTGSMVDLDSVTVHEGALSMRESYDNGGVIDMEKWLEKWNQTRPPKPPPDPNKPPPEPPPDPNKPPPESPPDPNKPPPEPTPDPNKPPPEPPTDPNKPPPEPPPDPNKPTIRTAFYSEIEQTFDTPQDWTRDGIEVLSLWFYGDPNNDPEPMYVAVADSTDTLAVVYHDYLDVPWIDNWRKWNIDLKDFTDLGVNLTGISSIAIGFGDRHNPQPGGAGTVYFDDITLGADPCPIADDSVECKVYIETYIGGKKQSMTSPSPWTFEEKVWKPVKRISDEHWDFRDLGYGIELIGIWIYFENFDFFYVYCHPDCVECELDYTQSTDDEGMTTVTVYCTPRSPDEEEPPVVEMAEEWLTLRQ